MLHAHERTIARPEEKACIDKCIEKRSARNGIESPETSGLGLGEPKPRHLDEFTLNAPNDVVDRSAESRCHLSLRQGLQAYKLGVDEPGLATPVPAGPSAKGLAAIAGIVGLSALRFRTRVMSPVGSLHLLFLH